MDINTVIEFLQHKETKWSCRFPETIVTSFDVKPCDFLSFAEIDLTANYTHNLINALSNAKRALDCQLDTLLIGFGFYDEAKSRMWSFPKKIEKIKELGILAPRVLNKINRTRNLMEHSFVKPDRAAVEDFVDIASLFLASTDKYIYSLPGYCELENKKIPDFRITMELVLSTSILYIDYVPVDGDRISKEYTSKDKEFLELLKAYLSIGMSYD